MKKLKLGLFILLFVLLVDCNIVQSQKEDDKTLELLAVSSLLGSGGTCSINVVKSGRTVTASANPVSITTTQQSVSYSKVPVVSHSIAVSQIANATVGQIFEFKTVDVADFDGDLTDALPLIYNTSDCPIATSSQLDTTAKAAAYTRSVVDSSTWRYTINTAGSYSFVIYQLVYPAIASTVRRVQ
ncbi:MAG: hypothetical protein EBS19_09355 [Spirochaetia bacterium]|nr:hypothetical protein [Spirochaetia bacterium]